MTDEGILEVENPPQQSESQFDKEDYKKKLKIKFGCFFIFFALVVGVEFAYRQTLFDYSVTFEEKWQNREGENSTTEKFFKVITQLGTTPGFLTIFAIIFLFFPLPHAINYLLGLSITSYLTNFLKGLYKSDRPYWENEKLKTGCDGGYGNPSGHSVTSVFMYLALWNELIKIKAIQKNIFVKAILLVIFLGLAITIILSRLFLGFHAVNQVLYGSTIGLSFYILLYHIVNLGNLKLIKYHELFTNIKMIIIISIATIALIAMILISYFASENKQSALETLEILCPDLKSFRILKKDFLFGSLTIFFIIGAYYGQIVFWKLTLKNYSNSIYYINHWNVGLFPSFKNIKKLGIFLLVVIVCGCTFLLNVIISNNANAAIIFIFKVSMAFFLPAFLMLGPGLHVLIILRVANSKIYERDNQFIGSDQEKSMVSQHSDIQESSDEV